MQNDADQNREAIEALTTRVESVDAFRTFLTSTLRSFNQIHTDLESRLESLETSAPSLSYNTNVFHENAQSNDGTIADPIVVTLDASADWSVQTGEDMALGTHYTLSADPPEGLALVVRSNSAKKAVVSLVGDAAQHEASDSTALTITFLDAAFSGRRAPVDGTQNQVLELKFLDDVDRGRGGLFPLPAGSRERTPNSANAKSMIGFNTAEPWNAEVSGAFKDLIRFASSARSFNPTNFQLDEVAFSLDDEGYPTSVPTGQYAACYVRATDGRNPSGLSSLNGDYLFRYEGVLDLLEFAHDATLVSHDPTQKRATVRITGPSVWLYWRPSVSDHARNFVMVKVGYESSHEAEPFTQAFLNDIAPYKVLRPMQWLLTNMALDDPERDFSWEKRTKPNSLGSSRRGVCWEHIIALCNRNDMHLWLCCPALADDDYMARLARAVKANLDPGLKVFLEWANETWNAGYPYYQAAFAVEKFMPDVFTDLLNSDYGAFEDGDRLRSMWYWRSCVTAMRTDALFSAFEREYEVQDIGTRVKRVYPSFAGLDQVRQGIDWWEGEGHSLYDRIDHLATNPYFGFHLDAEVHPTQVATLSTSTPAQIRNIIKDTPTTSPDWDRTIERVVSDNLQRHLDWISENMPSATLVAYEGGLHIQVANGTDVTNQKLDGFATSAEAGNATEDMLTRWKALGGQWFNIFSLHEGHAGQNRFGHKQSVEAPLAGPRSVKHKGVADWIVVNPTDTSNW